ncbi:UDP-3-O-(3-hydroxymyristoyl)glucosamine N-acyltransferase [Eisenibacter elegans]|jgi:UDP-3-O-[3-hydroxymyristoyl] glucosamine N-acyltransferase|uniref:UDP-3-O-(3-hydroxymyristoyl)glucosamine N-acyltransferase n=1 Tax=Eisenibacter elegans TaxID=997 RepID=UPI0003F9C8D3|nr:UDP-3-O-(3-hydroxymyristoyl)glucosamine N-acyltransferase [Eisenibacter elegans]
MKFTVQQIAQLINGDIQGDAQATVATIAKIDEPAPEESICFLANDKYENFLYTTTATAVMVRRGFVPKKSVQTTLIFVDDPYIAFTRLLGHYHKLTNPPKVGIEQPCFIHPEAKIGQNCYVGAFAYIDKGAVIGDNVQIHPQSYVGEGAKIGAHTVLMNGARVQAHCSVGAHCQIHPAAVVGSDGFGFAPQADGSYVNIPQLGTVIVEDYVSIGANTTIDRATFANTATIIRKGVKLDNLIQVGHNVEIGAHTVISAQSGISGSTKIGQYCVLGGQVGVANSLSIADRVKIGAKSGINRNIKEEGRILQGYPALDFQGFLKSSVIFRKLPELQKRVEDLEKHQRNHTAE